MRARLIEALALVSFLFAAAPPLHSQEVVASPGVVTISGVVANVNWGTSRGTLEIQSFQSTGKPVRSFVEGLDLGDLRAKGLPRNVFQRGDNLVVCGSPSRTVRPDGLISISADLITLGDGRQVILANDGATDCLSSAARQTPSSPERGRRGGTVPMGSPISPMGTPPVQPMLTPPIQPVVNSPVQPVTSPPVLPLGSPGNGATRSAVAPGQALQRIPLDAIDLSYLQLYDHDRPMQLTGRVTRVDWTQPNTYIYLTVNGTAWLVESSFTQFRQVAASPSIRIGDTITVSGYLPKDNPPDQLPAKTSPTAGPYLQSNHLVRAGNITIFTGQRLTLGDPPSDEELAKRERCSYFLGC